MNTMASNKYVRYVEGVVGKGTLVPVEEIEKLTSNPTDKDVYVSIAKYTEEHKKQFDQSGSVAGIKDVTVDKLCFDLDSKDNVELAHADGKALVERLESQGIDRKKQVEYYMSGNKGFTIVVNLDHEITPEKARYLATQVFGKGLKTLDTTIYNASRILRVPNSKHQVSGLYKIQLKPSQFQDLNIEQIKELAKVPGSIKKMESVKLAPELLVEKKVEKPKPVTLTLDMSQKPRHWKDYKYAILQGWFESGERHHALLVLAATCRGLGYDRDLALALCTAAAEKQAARTGKECFDLRELESNIIDQSVFSPVWQGGQYSPENDAWLAGYCEKMGFDAAKDDDKSKTVSIGSAFDSFKDYATNIDNLTINTGIKELDRKLRMTVGMSVGILAGPGVGKTSLSLQILNNMSKENIQSIFFSYDMFHALVIQKLIQKHKQISGDEIFARYKAGDEVFHNEIQDMLENEYRNVRFCFEAGQSISQIEETIKKVEQETGRKVKLVVIDYNELVQTDNGDATAASAIIAQNIRRIANTYNLCAVSLLQPNKQTGSPSDEIKSYRSIKGSSALEQAASVILGMSRPGFDPRHPEDDKFMTINCLKNRMGGLFSLDLHWEGVTGMVSGMTPEQKNHLNKVRERIKMEAEGDKDDSWG